jgi:hypothetical protein
MYHICVEVRYAHKKGSSMITEKQSSRQAQKKSQISDKNAQWPQDMQDLFFWFFDYLRTYPATKKNNAYKILLDRIAEGPSSKNIHGMTLCEELRCIKKIVDREISKHENS